MRAQALSDISDTALLHDMPSFVARECTAMAAVLARLAEIDERRLYLPAGFPSMLDYCIHGLHLSEEAAKKRLRVGRTARQFPAVLDALANGRLHLSAVILLNPYLTSGNVDDLIAAATHQPKTAIEEMLATRFPTTELLTLVETIPATRSPEAVEPAPVISDQRSPGTVDGARRVAESAPVRSTVAPVAAQRFALHLMMNQRTKDLLGRAQELMSHRVPSGDLGEVITFALELAVRHLEKQKYAATAKPQTKRRSTNDTRHIPAHVKRAVRERDGDQCTFVSESGQRCPSRRQLEFDHVVPVAQGGESTVENIRIRCKPHNQFAAECTFGAGFMQEKRDEARRSTCESRAPKRGRSAGVRTIASEQADDRVAWYRLMDALAEESRRSAASTAGIGDSSSTISASP